MAKTIVFTMVMVKPNYRHQNMLP